MAKWTRGLVCFCIILMITGCSVKEYKTDKLKDLEFTVVDADKLPENLAPQIEERKEKPMKLTYEEQDYLYIVVGYGTQETSGYSIEVSEFYETENAIYIHTNLLGPSNEEKVEKVPTYPTVVVKIENIDKNVVFN